MRQTIICSFLMLGVLFGATSETDPLKAASLEILKTKCNVCHKKQNPRKVFSLENMDDLAPRIYKQVFVKKRMPKGRKIKLTQEEYQVLENWLLTQSMSK